MGKFRIATCCAQLLLFYVLTVVLASASQISSKSSSSNQASGSESSVAVPKVEFEKIVLPNGLQIILHVDRKLPIAHVNLYVHVGSKDEKIGRTGFAHLFEHLMFAGSKNADERFMSLIEKAGGNIYEDGVAGFTFWDTTVYSETVPAGNLEYILWLESDRLATLADALTEEKLDNAKDVIKNEYRESIEDQPYNRWLPVMFQNLYPYQHPYSHYIIGDPRDVTAATLKEAKDFFKSYYTPNNMSLVVAGDFDIAETKRLVEKYFASIPAGPPVDRPIHWATKLDGEKIIEVRDQISQERTYFTWLTPAYFDPGDAELDLALTILTDGLQSRLNKILVHDKQLCSDVGGYQWSKELDSNLVLWATARPGVQLSEVEQVVTQEIAKLARDGPTIAELNRAKTRWEFQNLSNIEKLSGKASFLNMYNIYLGRPDMFEADAARYNNATAEGVRQAVSKWLDTRNRLLVRIRPKTVGRESDDVVLDRSKRPPFGETEHFQAPEVKTAKLENGLDVFVVERHDLPKVAVHLAVRVGSVADPAGKDGLADMVVSMLMKGTRSKDVIEVESSLRDIGTSIEGGADREYSSVSLEVLKRHIAPAIEILADTVLNPAFSDTELAKEKNLRIDLISQEKEDPNTIAFHVARMLAFGSDHPYGRPIKGWPETVQRITRDDLVKFHKEYWKPEGAALVFVGDISLAEATQLAKASFGNWFGGPIPTVAIPPPRPMGPGKVFVVDRPDATQTVAMQVVLGPARKSQDYYALLLADAVWGGFFGTRLNTNLREEKGYSYTVFSTPELYSKYGIWESFAGVEADKTKESVVELIKELKNLSGAKPITDAELTHAKVNRIRGYAQQFDSLKRIAEQIAAVWAADLPVAEIQHKIEGFDKVTLSDVNTVAQKYARPEAASLLLIGNLSKIKQQIQSLNLGECVVLDVEDKLVVKR